MVDTLIELAVQGVNNPSCLRSVGTIEEGKKALLRVTEDYRAPNASYCAALDGAIIAEFADLIICGARFAITEPGWASSIILSKDFFTREVIETVEVAGGARPRNVINELVGVHYNRAHLVSASTRAASYEFKRLLLAEIGPVIERVGHVAFQDSPEGFIVVSLDDGSESRGHGSHSPENARDELDERAFRDGLRRWLRAKTLLVWRHDPERRLTLWQELGWNWDFMVSLEFLKTDHQRHQNALLDGKFYGVRSLATAKLKAESKLSSPLSGRVNLDPAQTYKCMCHCHGRSRSARMAP